MLFASRCTTSALSSISRSTPVYKIIAVPTCRMSSSTSPSKKPRAFAPLKKGAPSNGLPTLKGIVFDVDGTLCKPQNHMFAQMRSALAIPKSIDILEHIYALPTQSERDEAMEKIRAIEREAMKSQEAQPGLVELMAYLDSRSIRKGICTRNFDAPVAHLLGKFLEGSEFGPIVTREFRPPKPDPAGILHIARSWGLVHTKVEGEGEERGDGSDLIMVGDSIDDMAAGRRAGSATVLLVNPVNGHLAKHEDTDLVISRLDDLIDILEAGFKGGERL